MNRVRYGVIGIKGIGNLHIRFARENERVELTALADLDEDILKERTEELGVCGFTDYRKMLDAGIVDAVSVATPHYLHAPMVLDCLNAGVHVFVEKPLAVCVSDAESIVRLAKTKNLKLSVGHQYRTFRSSRTMKYIIDTGVIGKIRRVLWSWVEFRPESYYARDTWRRTWRYSGGGISMHNVSHDLDLICWMIGKPVRVAALMGNQLHNIETEDVFCANIQFETGAFASVQATINQPSGYSIRQVAGDKGIIVMPDVKSLTFDRKDQVLLGKYECALSTAVTEGKDDHYQPKTKWQSVKLIGDPSKWKKLMEHMGLVRIKRPHGISVLMDSFIDSILNGTEPLVSGESTLPSLELINAILLSAARKRTVDLPIDRDECDQLFEELISGKTLLPTSR